MMTIILAMALGAASVDQAKALVQEAGVPVRLCMQNMAPSENCLRLARAKCVARLAGDERGDPMIGSMCAEIENDGWEALRLDAEFKLEAVLSRRNEPDVLASAKTARKAWKAYRDGRCEAESLTAPRAFTAKSNLLAKPAVSH